MWRSDFGDRKLKKHKNKVTFRVRFVWFCWWNILRSKFQFSSFPVTIKQQQTTMAMAEGPCYTIINSPELTEAYNEMKLKKDLGKFPFHNFPFLKWMNVSYWTTHSNSIIHRATSRRESPNRNVEEGDQTAAERWTPSRPADDNHPVRDAINEPHDQEIVADFLGNCAENHTGRQIVAGNDSRLWRISKGTYSHTTAYKVKRSSIWHLFARV